MAMSHLTLVIEAVRATPTSELVRACRLFDVFIGENDRIFWSDGNISHEYTLYLVDNYLMGNGTQLLYPSAHSLAMLKDSLVYNRRKNDNYDVAEEQIKISREHLADEERYLNEFVIVQYVWSDNSGNGDFYFLLTNRQYVAEIVMMLARDNYCIYNIRSATDKEVGIGQPVYPGTILK